MTAVVAWLHRGNAYICADSAVTVSDVSPRDEQSSFGQRQESSRGTVVEEAAFKLLRIADDVLVGVCGDERRAMGFLQVVSDDLRRHGGSDRLRESLEELRPAFAEAETFDIVFAHRVSGRSVLTVFSTRGGILTRDDEDVRHTFILGRLPFDFKRVIGRAATVLRDSSLPPEVVQLGMLAVLQAFGVTENFPHHGVGGAFFGASLTPAAVEWQPDVGYVLYTPDTFSGLPLVDSLDGLDVGGTPPRLFESVRVMVRAEGGFTISSISSPGIRIFVPATSRLSPEAWEAIADREAPDPVRVLDPDGRYFAFVSLAAKKALVLAKPDGAMRGRPVLQIDAVGKGIALRLTGDMTRALERPVDDNAFEVAIAVEPTEGTATSFTRFNVRLT